MKIFLSLATTCLMLLISLSTCTASLAQFAGDWTNVDTNTGGITTLSIGISGASANVQAWGKCHPTDCDWGTVPAFAFAPDVSSDLASQAQALVAIFDSGFSETTLFIKPQGNRLWVQSYTRFKDNSGRSNYASSDAFQKSSPIIATGIIAEVKPLQKFNKLEVLPLMRTIGNN
jgi:hypothetical protein